MWFSFSGLECCLRLADEDPFLGVQTCKSNLGLADPVQRYHVIVVIMHWIELSPTILGRHTQ